MAIVLSFEPVDPLKACYTLKDRNFNFNVDHLECLKIVHSAGSPFRLVTLEI